MKAGQVVLFRFPLADLTAGKLRPALLIRRVPGAYDDWLLCMISSQLRQYIDGFDEVVYEQDEDFVASGLKAASVIRLGRLAVVEAGMLVGSVGEVSHDRLHGIKRRLAQWFTQEE